MSNLKVNNYNNLKLRINKDEYWDFYVNKDSFGAYNGYGAKLYDNCLISYIDSSDDDCVSGNTWLFSKNNYQWESAYTTNSVLSNIGYTGIDNGLITYRKDRISNKQFVDIFTGSTYNLTEGDNRLKLHAVSGTNLIYDYPVSVEDGNIKLNGGFYQGFFKTKCDEYYILPSNMDDNDVWEFEFELNRCELESESDKTLNNKYPNNKGIFFYIGTRAENKWIYLYDKEDREECTQLGEEDYVEDGGIDRRNYIISNFFDLDPEYYDDNDIDNYLNFNYYEESLYHPTEDELFSDIVDCDGENLLDDYLDMEIKPRVIDENLPHETLSGWCCNCSETSKKETVQVAFFSACGCLKFKNVRKEKALCDGEVACDDIFGEDLYIDDFDGLEADGGYFEPELNISNFIDSAETSTGFKLLSANDYYFYTNNKFLLFDRTKKGYTVDNWIEGTKMMYYGKRDKFKGNLFILMNRTKTGYTVNNIDELRDKANNTYDSLYKDIYGNAFALRITDEGEIGYRYLVLDCESEEEGKYSVMEGYSFANVISECEWHTVHVRMAASFDKMKLYFYVDGKLVYITKDLPKLNLHELDDLYEKQEGVPFNISLGGGTQGLAETIVDNYMLEPTRVYPLEQNFAGSFVGYMKSFKFYNCKLEYTDIYNNFLYENSNII